MERKPDKTRYRNSFISLLYLKKTIFLVKIKLRK